MKNIPRKRNFVYIHNHKLGAMYSGHVRKRNGRWWFLGNVCRDIKMRLCDAESNGWIIAPGSEMQ